MPESLRKLYKINSKQIYLLWRNFVATLLVVVAMVVLIKLLPPICAPIVSTVACTVFYFMVYSRAFSDAETCVMVPFTMFLVSLVFTVLFVAINLLCLWNIIKLPTALMFFDGYVIPGLLYCPVAVVVSTLVYLRRHRLNICSECRLHNGSPIERGRAGIMFSHESEFQLKNLILIFSIASIYFWCYFLFDFSEVSITNRDTFVFTWGMLILLVVDVLFFSMRYYNVYLDLKERNELVSPEDIKNISTSTYLRFYVICEDSIYLVKKENVDLKDEHPEVLDTPFVRRRIMKSVPEQEVRHIIEKDTGVNGGLLRFFFGRRVNEIAEHRILRYFYFLPGELSAYPRLATMGEWLSSEKFKTLYNTRPFTLSNTILADMSRLATIVVTSKLYNEHGERRNKLMHYRPSFSFAELRNSDINFQDELWIRVSMFNSDKRFFRLKRFLHHFERKHSDMPYNHTHLS